MVLLDILMRHPGLVISEEFTAKDLKNNIIIAHFNHGIRKEAKRDAEFVKSLAKKYDLPFALGEAKLGAEASEESARQARYEFLRSVAGGSDPRANRAVIVTAHHQDDLIETIVMNILRGTGWRGLAPFWSDDILRPLLDKTKAEIVQYAIKHNLEWVEDETNYSPRYFRNRVRFALDRTTSKQRSNLLKLYNRQKNLRSRIENALEPSGSDPLGLEAIVSVDNAIAQEILNKLTNNRLTTPQIKRLIEFLRTAKSGDICQPGGGLQVGLYKNQISISKLGDC